MDILRSFEEGEKNPLNPERSCTSSIMSRADMHVEILSYKSFLKYNPCSCCPILFIVLDSRPRNSSHP